MNKPLFAIGVSMAVFAVFLLSSVAAMAHGGGIDGNGCHNNRALGIYECHRGDYAGTTWESREEFEAITTLDPDWTKLNVRLVKDSNPNNPFTIKEDRFTIVQDGYIYYLEFVKQEGTDLYEFVRVYDRKPVYKPPTFLEYMEAAKTRRENMTVVEIPEGTNPFEYLRQRNAEPQATGSNQ